MTNIVRHKSTGKTMALILASASAGRREILQNMGLDFIVDPADIDESKYQEEHQASVEKLVEILAREKALATSKKHMDGLIIAADTVVVYANKIIGKPQDEDDAKNILSVLSGATHQVFTGLALLDITAKKILQKIVVSEVDFRSLSKEEINSYVASGEPMGRAGAYASQGGAKEFISRIKGDYTNVIGLPKMALIEAMADLGYTFSKG